MKEEEKAGRLECAANQHATQCSSAASQVEHVADQRNSVELCLIRTHTSNCMYCRTASEQLRAPRDLRRGRLLAPVRWAT